MSRVKGLASFSGNFEPQIAAPLDARDICETKAELVLPATWTANDGGVYAFKCMIVSVRNDTTTNNGVYRLDGDDYTNISNWQKLGVSGAVLDNSVIVKPAGATISLYRVLVSDSVGSVTHADNSSSVASQIVGVSMGAASAGADVSIKVFGEIVEPTWSWIADKPIFLNGMSGQLSQTPPVAGFSQIMGFPINTNSMLVKIDRPITLI